MSDFDDYTEFSGLIEQVSKLLARFDDEAVGPDARDLAVAVASLARAVVQARLTLIDVRTDLQQHAADIAALRDGS